MTKVDTLKINVVPKEITVGTKEGDVYNNTKLLEIFNFADKNGDKVIDEAEMRRLKGPLLVVEKDDQSKQRFIGGYEGKTGFVPSKGCVNGEIIKTSEFDFYPGLKREDIKGEENNKLVLSYRDLDSDPCDGELSKEEIERYQTYVERKKKYTDIVNTNEDKKKRVRYREIFSPIVGTIGGIIAGILSHDFFEVNFACSDKRCLWNNSRGLAKVCSIGLGLAVLGGSLWYSHNYRKTKKPMSDEEMSKIHAEYADIAELDKQYKNVYKKE